MDPSTNTKANVDRTSMDLESVDSQQLQNFFRNSLHWEDYFGSSVDLTRAILSIYDKFVSVNDNDSTDNQQPTESECTSDKGEGHTDRDQPATHKSNQRSSSPSHSPEIQTSSSFVAQQNGLTTFDGQQTVSSNTINPGSLPTICLPADNMLDDNATLDSRKRPLSISSMSSASSSSLPRHSCYKRLNMTDAEVLINGPSQGNNVPSIPLDNTDLESVVSTEDLIDSESIASSFDGTCRGYEEDRTSQTQDVSPGGGIKLFEPQQTVCEEEEESVMSSVSSASSSTPHHLASYTLQQQQQQDGSSSCRNSCSPSSSLYELLTDDSKPTPTDIDEDGGESGPSSLTHYVSYIQRVVTEIVETEQTYVKCLKEMKEGYLEYLDKCDEISKDQIKILFGNIVQIYSFSQKFLQELELCEGDPLKVAECFVKNKDKFVIYGHYCTNYPSALETLTKCMAHQNLADIFKQRQLVLGHNLPLGAYLLKPVQRVLKYHLLLQNILKHYDEEKEGFDVLCQALTHMTSMAQHINEMKRKHEHAVRIQEIQSQLLEYDGADLTTLGDLIIEGSLRICGTKTYRQVFLFEKAVLITKKKEEGMLSCKSFIECANLMLIESIPKEPLSFQVIPFDNPKSMQTLQARNMEQKMKWCQEIKHLILESYKGKIPEKVRHLVMELGRSKDEQCEKLECLNTFQLFDASNSENVDPGKRHQISGLDYLEKRGRVRRKSSNLIPDFNLLKPQKLRKGYRRSDPGFPRLTGTLINRRRGGPLYASPEPEAGPEVESEVCSESGYDIEKHKTESLPGKNSSSYKRALSFRNAISDNPQHIPDVNASSVSCSGSSCGSVQSTPARLHRPKNAPSETTSNEDSSSVTVPTKYASMPSLNNEKTPVNINMDPSGDASLSTQSLVPNGQSNSLNSGDNQQKKNNSSGKSEVQSKLSAPQSTKPKKSFKNVLPLLRQAKMAGLLPGITFKYYGSEPKTRRSSDPPVSYEDPWVRKSELHQSVSQNEVSSSQSLRRSQLESPNYKNMSRESLDWLVYLNRNQLPANKYITPIQSLMQTTSKERQTAYQEVPSYVTLPRGATSPTDIPKGLLHKSFTFCGKSAKPSFMRSYSTPPSKRVTPDKDEHPASSIAAIKESERMVEEMENYMRTEGESTTLAKFPTKLPEQSDIEAENSLPQNLSRQASQTSLLSNSSQSSYESNLGSTESLVSQIQSFPAKVAGWKANITKSPTPPVFTLPPPSAYKKKIETSASVPCSPLSKDDDSSSFLHYPCVSTTESLSTSLNSPVSGGSVSSPTLNASKNNIPFSFSCSSPPQITSTSSSPLPSPVRVNPLVSVHDFSQKSSSMPSSPFHLSSTWDNIETYPQYHSPAKSYNVSSSPNSTPERSVSTPLLLPTFSTPTKTSNCSVSNPALSKSCQMTHANEDLPLTELNNHITPDKTDLFSIPSDQLCHANSSPEIEETAVKNHGSFLELPPNKCQSSSHSMPSLTRIASKSTPSSPTMSSKVLTSNTLSPPRVSRSTDRRNSAPQNCHKEVKSALRIRHQSLKLDHNVSLSSLFEGVPSTSPSDELVWSPNNRNSHPLSVRCINHCISSSSDDVFHKKLTGSHENFGKCQHLDKSLCQKTNLQPSDSAFSIQSETTDNLHEDGDTNSNSRLSTSEGSFISVDSICEQQSAETELFRDSAIYCDMDIEPSPIVECPLPPKATIKEYVQYLEEKHKFAMQPKMSGAKKREPSQMIRQRLRSLQEHAHYKSNRRSYEEEVMEVSQISVREINRILTSGATSIDDSRCPYHSTASVPLIRNLGKCSHSLGSLDRLNCEPVNTKGWVKQVVTKFQTDH